MLFCDSGRIHSDYGNIGIRYIDEGFLVWIILSMYQSYEALNRAYTTDFARIQFYRVLSIFCCFLSLEDKLRLYELRIQ